MESDRAGRRNALVVNVAAQEFAAALRKATESSRAVAPKGRVLVVDDEDAWLCLVREWLEDAGYEVLVSKDAAALVELVKRHAPDCLILDYQLDGVTAKYLLSQFNTALGPDAVPVIVLTSHRKEKVAALYAGAQQFVAKEGKPDELLAAVHVCLRTRANRKTEIAKGDVSLQLTTRVVTWKGAAAAELSDDQCHLFQMLLRRSPSPVSRDELLSSAGLSSAEQSRAPDRLVSRLKERLPDGLRDRIVSIRGCGWAYQA